jgi:hypothetical protein
MVPKAQCAVHRMKALECTTPEALLWWPPAKKDFVIQLFLCLPRACLGKLSGLSTRWRKKDASAPQSLWTNGLKSWTDSSIIVSRLASSGTPSPVHHTGNLQKTASLSNFSDACPEPVLAKRSLITCGARVPRCPSGCRCLSSSLRDRCLVSARSDAPPRRSAR